MADAAGNTAAAAAAAAAMASADDASNMSPTCSSVPVPSLPTVPRSVGPLSSQSQPQFPSWICPLRATVAEEEEEGAKVPILRHNQSVRKGRLALD